MSASPTPSTEERERLTEQLLPIVESIKVTVEIQAGTLVQTYIGTKTATRQIANLILADRKQLLAKVREEVIGDGELHVSHVCPPNGCLDFKARNLMRVGQNAALDKLEKEYT